MLPWEYAKRFPPLLVEGTLLLCILSYRLQLSLKFTPSSNREAQQSAAIPLFFPDGRRNSHKISRELLRRLLPLVFQPPQHGFHKGGRNEIDLEIRRERVLFRLHEARMPNANTPTAMTISGSVGAYELTTAHASTPSLARAALSDKKRRGSKIALVLPERIGAE